MNYDEMDTKIKYPVPRELDGIYTLSLIHI